MSTMFIRFEGKHHQKHQKTSTNMAEINIKKKTGRYEKPPTIALLKSLFPTISSPSIEHGQKSAGEGAIVS